MHFILKATVGGSMKKRNTKRFTLLALFIAIEIAISLIPFLGYIPLGFINATTLHIPVIIGGILLGKKEGAILGFVFGLTSLIKNTMEPSLTSFVFSPFISVGGIGGNWQSLLITFIPRILIGFVAGLLYEKLRNKTNDSIAIGTSAIIASLTNTILVLGGIYVFFGVDYANAINIAQNTLFSFIMGIVATSGVAEAIVASVITIAIVKVGAKTLRLSR